VARCRSSTALSCCSEIHAQLSWALYGSSTPCRLTGMLDV
jgi:hypothetical protein